jgi:signal transduction histidine kinase
VIDAVTTRLTDGWTYRRLLYLLSGFPLGHVWFIALVTGWSLCAGLLVTPLIIPLLMGMAALIRGAAALESSVARSLLGIEIEPRRAAPSGAGFWTRFRSLFRGGFWRTQAYMLVRWIAGLTLGVAVFSLLATALGLIFAPIWVPFVHGGADLGFWHPHSFLQCLALVPVGLVLLPVTLLIVNPLARIFEPVADSLLGGGGGEEPASAPGTNERRGPTRRGFEVFAAVCAVIVGALTLIWALTGTGYYWPVWVALPLAAVIAIQWWLVALEEQPELVHRFRRDRGLAVDAGVCAVLALFFVAIWAITGHGYFWPVWPILALAVVVGIHAAAVLLSAPDHAELTERIETLQTSRAGAVDVQETELRRIERDLHDGAQARLVALGMSLGMAEQKLAENPQEAAELLAEARVGTEQALRELRDLARGIHPPVLTDRGLEAAVAALVTSNPLKVTLTVDVPERPRPAVETATYFVVAEALANATKHSGARNVDIRIRLIGDALVAAVTDDGDGGADPEGSGLSGLRRRVDALDGSLQVTSPPGGPTTVRTEIPCG